jgi:hypothetical protein
VSDLAEFLRVRLDEDEANAGNALAQWPDTHFTINPGSLVIVEFHRRRHPARVLREVEAKRAILTLHAGSVDHDYPQEAPVCGTCGEWGPCETLRALSPVYSDHPDYDPVWRE